MPKHYQSPSLVRDLGTLAELYRNVFLTSGYKKSLPIPWPRAGESRLGVMDAAHSREERSDEAVEAKR